MFDILIQLCLAMKNMHDQRIIHRDIKPRNIFVTKDNVLKLGDFGLATWMGSKSKTSSLVGTPQYFSPEMIKGEGYGF